jgi:hypothetical protein
LRKASSVISVSGTRSWSRHQKKQHRTKGRSHPILLRRSIAAMLSINGLSAFVTSYVAGSTDAT